MISSEKPDNELVDVLCRRDIMDLKALHDIFSGNKKDIEYYFEGRAKSKKGPEYWAETITKKYPDEAQEYINIRNTRFKKSELGMNDITDYLADEKGIDRGIIEDINSDYHKLLILVYHSMYDPEEGALTKEYDKMESKAKIFRSNKKEIYYCENLNFDMNEAINRVDDFVQRKNEGATQAFTVRDFSTDEKLRMKFFSETSRTARQVFQFRKEGKEKPPSKPTVQSESTHNIKTIMIEAVNKGGDVEIILPKNKNGWKEHLNDFFEDVLEIEGGWNSVKKREASGANKLIDEVKKVADDEGATERDVIEKATETVEGLSENALDELQNSA
jgi:hypothetical protein